MNQSTLPGTLYSSWIQNLYAVIIVAVTIFILPPQKIMTLFIIMGQAHFALTYLYQYRAGKLSRHSIIFQIFLLGLLFTFTTPALYPWFLTIAGTLFCIHFFQDEIKMFSETSGTALFLSGSALTAAYFGFLAQAAFPTFVILPHALAVGALLLLTSFFVTLNEEKKPVMLHYYFATLYASFFLLWISGIYVPVESLLGSIILLHYVRWYIYYYCKLSNNSTEQRKYVYTSVSINISIFLVYLASTYFLFLMPVYTYFFTPLFFFSWTFLHILFSLRKSDYAFVSRLLSNK